MENTESKKDFRPEIIGTPTEFQVGSKKVFVSRQKIVTGSNTSEHLVVEVVKLSKTGVPYKRPTSIWVPVAGGQQLIDAIKAQSK
jgi:hypothetical protein